MDSVMTNNISSDIKIKENEIRQSLLQQATTVSQEDYINKVYVAKKLKNYAVSKGLNIPDNILKVINVSTFSLSNNDFPVNLSTDLDAAIRDLVKITYPTTPETLEFAEIKNVQAEWAFRILIVALTVLAISTAIWSSRDNSAYGGSFLALSLGLLGSLLFYLFNIIGLIEEKAINASDSFNNFVRILLGPIVGWIFYFGFCQQAFNNFYADRNAASLYLFLPFLVGFSTKLVVGILNQLIRAAQLTIGIEDKRTDLAIRNRKNDKNSTS